MRILILFFLGLGIAAEAAAQPQAAIERRVGRLEQDMRTVQRRVFPGGAPNTVDPEIQPPASVPARPGADTGDAIATLTARIDALEAQLARVTGQVEENGYRLSQLETRSGEARAELERRVAQLERAAAAAATPPQRSEPASAEPLAEAQPEPAGTAPASEGRPLDAVQEAYNAGFRLWEQRRFAQAAAALTEVADRNPRSRWASWSRNLAGRAYLDDNKPATAARVFLQNYQDNPRGERAADSLFYLGEALVKLNRQAEACPVYDELQSNYPDMRAFLRERLPAARRAARCN